MPNTGYKIICLPNSTVVYALENHTNRSGHEVATEVSIVTMQLVADLDHGLPKVSAF